jgi:hypothetical protein
LILYFSVDVKTLFEKGKDYQWEKPEICPKCKGNRLWSHGFVQRYFEGLTNALWVKKYRCPDCESVHTCRPEGFFKKFIYSVNTISSCLKSKIEDYLWSKEFHKSLHDSTGRGSMRREGGDLKSSTRRRGRIREGRGHCMKKSPLPS